MDRTHGSLFGPCLSGVYRASAESIIRRHHYTHCVPSGKSYWFSVGPAIVVFSIPANRHIGKFLLGRECECWEMSRLWAPSEHDDNLLTAALCDSVTEFKKIVPDCEVLVSWADPNIKHTGGIYRAASWMFTGISEENRYYVDSAQNPVARRKFHSNKMHKSEQEILNLGYKKLKRPGKLRFARGLTKESRECLQARFGHIKVLPSPHEEVAPSLTADNRTSPHGKA